MQMLHMCGQMRCVRAQKSDRQFCLPGRISLIKEDALAPMSVATKPGCRLTTLKSSFFKSFAKTVVSATANEVL